MNSSSSSHADIAGDLSAETLTLSYGRTPVVQNASLRLRPGLVTALIGPNGSGKSTVLRALARLHRIDAGRVQIGGEDTTAYSAREFARTVAMLSQSRPHPSGLAVYDVVAYGRHPHRSRFAGLTDTDREAINRALDLTGLTLMTDRPVDELSGGELQRVWLATSLAQDTGVLLLDEPTNHLDLRYQVETLDLVRDLADRGTALGVVLHDLNQAATVADQVVLMHNGQVRATGTPEQVLTSEHLSQAYGLTIDTSHDTTSGCVRIAPRGRHHARGRKPLLTLSA